MADTRGQKGERGDDGRRGAEGEVGKRGAEGDTGQTGPPGLDLDDVARGAFVVGMRGFRAIIAAIVLLGLVQIVGFFVYSAVLEDLEENDAAIAALQAVDVRRTEEAFLVVCRSANINAAFLQIERPDDKADLPPILDCPASVRGDDRSTLSVEIEEQYVRSIGNGKLSILDDNGQIVDEVPLRP